MNTGAELVDRFLSELKAVDGEAVLCRSIDQARQRVAELIEESQWERIGSADRPVCRELLSGLDAAEVIWTHEGWPSQEMAELPVGLMAAEWLLAETGSCAIECETAEERLLCYLPPTCLVIGRVDRLAEDMAAAWPEIARRAADPGRRGELVLVTGPSRTADIEKVLILGVHGPKRLVVLLVP